MIKTTLVTAFFDLTNLPDSNGLTRPVSFYLENGKYTLSQPFPMVIVCSPNLYYDIKKIRDENCPENQTFYIQKNLTDFELYNNIETIEKNRKNIEHYKDSRITPSYCVATNLKIYTVKMSYDNNPFNSSHFAWIDFGGGHVCKETISNYLPDIIKNPSDKIKVCYIHYRSSEELKNMKQYVDLGSCGIAGNFWTIEGKYIIKLFEFWNNSFLEQLSNGVGHADEQTLTYVYHKYPEMFELYYGDYKSVYSNYFDIIEDYHSIRWYFIYQALKKGSIDIARKAIKKVLEAEKKGYIKIDMYDKKYLESI